MRPETTIVTAGTGVPMVRYPPGLSIGHEPLSAQSTGRRAGLIDPEDTGE